MPQNINTENATTGQLTAKKRPRLSQATADGVAVGLEPDKAHEGRSHKRKRLDLIPQNNNEDTHNGTPEPVETEDISEEVQRRLEIKEEQRRKRNAGSGKRKRDRDSFAPFESNSSLASRPKKRRRETGATDAAAD